MANKFMRHLKTMFKVVEVDLDYNANEDTIKIVILVQVVKVPSRCMFETTWFI
jgi:hypothetical protein